MKMKNGSGSDDPGAPVGDIHGFGENGKWEMV
jgi:hypothetical protein